MVETILGMPTALAVGIGANLAVGTANLGMSIKNNVDMQRMARDVLDAKRDIARSNFNNGGFNTFGYNNNNSGFNGPPPQIQQQMNMIQQQMNQLQNNLQQMQQNNYGGGNYCCNNNWNNNGNNWGNNWSNNYPYGNSPY